MKFRNKFLEYVIGCCAIFFCAASVFGQVVTSPVAAWPLSEYCETSVEIYPDSDRLYYKADCYANSGFYQKALDSMRRYCEVHTFNDVLISGAINSTSGDAGSLEQQTHPYNFAYCYDEYNWLVRMQPLNNDPYYQSAIFGSLANMLLAVNDFNGAANMWWNYTKLFKIPHWQDSEYWGFIRSIRRHQALIPQDTTPFHLFTLPLQPLAGVAPSHDGDIAELKINISPNPAKDNLTLSFMLPQRNNMNIKIYDILGREVLNVISGAQDEGMHSLPIDLHGINPGSYYIRIEYTGGVRTMKLVHEK